MKRVILSVPEGLTFDALLPEQQTAISAVFGQHVNPMPGTQAAGGRQIVDAVTSDKFDPAAIAELALPFDVLALWQWDGDVLTTVQALAEASWMPYLPDTQIIDAEGVPTGTVPPVFHLPHQWAGWPAGV